MKEQPEKGPAKVSEWTALGVMVLISVSIFLIGSIAWNLLAGRPVFEFHKDLVPTILALPFMQFLVAKIGIGFKPLLETLPSETELAIRSKLDQHGFEKVSLNYRSLGNYPRPQVLPYSIFLSSKLINDCSVEAITWMICSELKCTRQRSKPEYLSILSCMIVGFILVGISARLNLIWLGLLLSSILVVGCFWYASNKTLKKQLECDLEFAVNAEDRIAAKEILSYAYFAQKDRWITDKFFYLSSELRRRAANLGIELERGFRAERPVELRPEATL